MHFTKTLASLLLASAVSAGPIARARSVAFLASRQLCQIGVPCVVQKEVNAALAYINTAVGILEGPVDTVIANVNSCATTLLQVEADLETDVAAVTADLRPQLEAQVVSAISALVNDIRADVSTISSNVTVTADLTTSVNAVTNAIAAIEGVVGPCN